MRHPRMAIVGSLQQKKKHGYRPSKLFLLHGEREDIVHRRRCGVFDGLSLSNKIAQRLRKRLSHGKREDGVAIGGGLDVNTVSRGGYV